MRKKGKATPLHNATGEAEMNAHSEFLTKSDCLLMLVDIQKVMLEPCVHPELVTKNAFALLEIAALLELPTIVTEHNSEKLGGFLPELLERAPRPQLFNKMEFSCLENDPILRALQKTDRTTLLLAGLESHVCVFHTGAHALRLGYRLHVATDAVSSRSELNKEIGLRRLEKAGAVISSTEMIIFELLNRAGTPEFRSALPLLKTL
jgi:nicotinamidase-related amidase